MDINLPGLSGLEATTRLQTLAPEVKVLILSVHDRREYVQQVARCGARGYVLKDASPAELIRAIYTVLQGGTYYSRRVATALAKALKTGAAAELSERERAVLLGVARGSSSKELAEQMSLSINTVRTYRDRLRRKLDLHNVAAFTEYALQNDLMEREA
jgi:two-component system nitrate/nitrite response regulator NarL